MALQIQISSAILFNNNNNKKKNPSINNIPRKCPCFAGKRLKHVVRRRVNLLQRGSSRASNGSSSSSSSNGSYSAGGGKQYELSREKVDMVLEEVRPYLIADGGNVDVVSVENGIISLQLQGACGTCPSSTTTMKMGIERVLKDKFGDAVKDIRQVNGDPVNETTTVEAVNRHLDILRPAIKNYGGEVDVIAIQGGDCTVKYDGPDTIGSGIKAAIREKFPEIVNVLFTK